MHIHISSLFKVKHYCKLAWSLLYISMASLRLNDCQKIARLELAASKLGSTPESKPPELNLYFSGTLTESEWVPSHDDDSGGELKLLRETSHPDHPVETCVLGVSLDKYLSSPEQT